MPLHNLHENKTSVFICQHCLIYSQQKSEIGLHKIKSGKSTETAFHPAHFKMSLNDILVYFAAETTTAQVLRFKQKYFCGIPGQLINFFNYFFLEVCYETLEYIDEFVTAFYPQDLLCFKESFA